MKRLRVAFFDLFRVMTTPDKFDGDPYGGLLNQWGHYTAAGIFFCILSGAYYFFAGEMPYKAPVAVAVVVAYVVVIEWLRQGWQGWDTVEDSTFVALGVSTVALSVQERGVEGYTSILAVDMPMLMLHFIGAIVAVFFYAWKRIA